MRTIRMRSAVAAGDSHELPKTTRTKTRMPVRRLPCFVLVVICLASPLCAENWPGWRGPRGDGSSLETHVPVEWDATSGKNVAWRVDVPGVGHSSPIVWENRIFLTTCLEDSTQRV